VYKKQHYIPEELHCKRGHYYVCWQECLPAGANHDWVQNVFSGCGKVVYVSLPKYRSTGDIKGFAFVEFDTVDAARAACLVCSITYFLAEFLQNMCHYRVADWLHLPIHLSVWFSVPYGLLTQKQKS